MQFFVWQKDSLVALGDKLGINGRFVGTRENWANTEIILMTHHIAYYFYVDIPVIINLDPTAEKYFCTTLPHDSQSDLEIIPVSAEHL